MLDSCQGTLGLLYLGEQLSRKPAAEGNTFLVAATCPYGVLPQRVTDAVNVISVSSVQRQELVNMSISTPKM